MQSFRHFFPILTRFGASEQIFLQVHNTKVHENPSSGIRANKRGERKEQANRETWWRKRAFSLLTRTRLKIGHKIGIWDCGLDWVGWPFRPFPRSCEHCNELGFHRIGNFLASWASITLPVIADISRRVLHKYKSAQGKFCDFLKYKTLCSKY
jgi:hypothetical protein